MATAAFRDWVRRGRQWFPATPVTIYRTLLHTVGWPWSALGTIGDEAHLQAETPQDHCPFSVTGWPGENPYPFVLALDVTHDPGAGLDAEPFVAYWVSEAWAGRTPWVKYIVFKGLRWDVRNDWKSVPADGHYDHAHISFRTDYYQASLGGWNPLGDNMSPIIIHEEGKGWWVSDFVSARPLGSEAEVDALKAHLGDVVAVENEHWYGVPENPSGPPAGGGGATVDPVALANALAANQGFVEALANGIAGNVELPLTPGDLAQAFQAAGESLRP